MEQLLDNIVKENDIKNFYPDQYRQLAKEIRRTLIRGVSRTGGHLASNLGTVELTMALHIYLSFPEDKLIWDVGHQSYTHKLLTGRKDVFCSLRSFGGISGFPKIAENPADTFNTGHSSTSLSAAMGFAKARDLNGEDHKVVAVIGDGALSGGMAFEALNNAAELNTSMMIVLNDNKMSISSNVGGMANYLGKIRTNKSYNRLKEELENALDKIPNMGKAITEKLKRSKDSIKRLFVPGMLFEDMGLTYIGPVNGHNINELLTAFRSAEKKGEPVIVHVVTKKGKGYPQAENQPALFHGVDPFDFTDDDIVYHGKLLNGNKPVTYTDVFSDWIRNKAKYHEDITAISAAMPEGTGLGRFAEEYPERFFDVGIAEEHAVTFAAGLAAGGMRPIVCLYSTFLQRAYDQILHDVCIGNLPVVFIVDRSGLVGKDGETHQGIYDISFLSSIPNLTVLSPMDEEELKESLDYAITLGKPIVVRYPKGSVYSNPFTGRKPIEYGKAEILQEEKDIAVIGVGSMMKTVIEAAEDLREAGKKVSVINARFIKPFDKECIKQLCKNHHTVVTVEENVCTGSFGQQVQSFINGSVKKKIHTISFTLPDRFIEHGKTDELKEKYGLDTNSIVERILK